MLVTQRLHLRPVRCTQVFSNDLFGDVAANILAVVAGLLQFRLPLLRSENFRQLFGWLLVDGRIEEDEGALVVAGGADELSEDGVVGLLTGEPVHGHKEFFVRFF